MLLQDIKIFPYVIWSIILIVFIYHLNIVRSIQQLVIFRALKNVPGPPLSNFLVGNIGVLRCSPDEIHRILRKWNSLYYPIYKAQVALYSTVCIMSPEDCELVLSNTAHNEKSRLYEVLWNWLGSGLLTSTGDKWQTRRKILTSAFHFNILQDFISVFNEESINLVETIRNECHKSYIKITPLIYQFTMQAIAETAMGTKLNKNDAKDKEYKDAILQLGKTLVHRLLTPWLFSNLTYPFTITGWMERKYLKITSNFTSNIIREHEKKFKGITFSDDDPNSDTKRKRLAMLDLLLYAKQTEGNIDDEGIREEVETFMFEGHDTTATAICFALMLIASHKDVQDQIVDELYTVFGDSFSRPTYNHIQELKYLERCIKETMRLYPSVHFISRVLGADMTTHSGYFLPKETMVHMHIFDLHRNPEIFPDPDRFDPDRFLPENVIDRHPFAYLPFSAGSRNCIGQRFAMLEMKAALSCILMNFILEPIDTQDTIVLTLDMVLRTIEDIKVRFIPRKQV